MASYLELHFKKILMALFLLTLLQNATSVEFHTYISWVTFHVHQYQLYWILLHRTITERTENATLPTVHGVHVASYNLETSSSSTTTSSSSSSSSSSIGTATLVGYGLLNYRWVFSAGRFLQTAVASGTSNPQLGGPVILIMLYSYLNYTFKYNPDPIPESE